MHTHTRRTTIAATAFAVALASSVAFGPATAASVIRAVVNGDVVTSNEIQTRTRLMQLSSHETGASLERAATEELIDEKLKLQEAKRVGVTVDDQQVDAAFASIAERMKIPPAALAQGLGQRGIDIKSFKTRLRAQIAWQQLVVARFNRSVNISDSQIVDALTKKEGGDRSAATSKAAGSTTAEYTLQQVVLVVASKGGSPEARTREAEALRAKVTSCDMLIDSVKGLSEATVKNVGKRIEEELPPNFRGLLGDVAIGHLSKPVRTAIGIEMLAVCGKRDITGDFQIRTKVEDELRNREGEVFARRYINDLRRIAVIEYKK